MFAPFRVGARAQQQHEMCDASPEQGATFCDEGVLEFCQA